MLFFLYVLCLFLFLNSYTIALFWVKLFHYAVIFEPDGKKGFISKKCSYIAFYIYLILTCTALIFFSFSFLFPQYIFFLLYSMVMQLHIHVYILFSHIIILHRK